MRTPTAKVKPVETTKTYPALEPRFHAGSPDPRISQDSLWEYWFLLKCRWRLIVIVTVIAFAWVLVMTKFVFTRWYQATALLRPSPPQLEATEMSSIATQVLGGGSLGSMLGAMGLDSQIQDEAEADMSVLQSYAFTMNLLRRHRLTPTIVAETRSVLDFGAGMTPWKLYQVMGNRFDCSFDIETGNITLTFLAPSRAEAARVLNFYVDDLREKLRLRQIDKAAAAITSLQQQAARTSDALLQQDLYDLLAKQVQRQQLAKVQADFAFTLIDPPVVPDKPHKPKVLLSSAIAAALALFASCGAFVMRERVSRSLQDYQRRSRTIARTTDEAPVRKTEELSSHLPRKQTV